MFNKGKPYVPPPTRSMGSANAHDSLHDLDDAELGSGLIAKRAL